MPRRTAIIDGEADVEDEDLIAREDMVITVTHGGYVKRTPLSTYRTQNRGGKGRAGMATKEEDAVTRVFVASTHAPVLFFSSGGKVYKLKVWRLPLAAPQARGKAFINLLPIEPGETHHHDPAAARGRGDLGRLDVMFATDRRHVRRNKLSDFVQVNRNGKIAMKLDEGDAIIGVQLCTEDDDILLTTARRPCIRFPVDEVRVFAGPQSTGVRGIRLAEGDSVISMAILRHVDATADERDAYLKMRRAIAARGPASDDAKPDAEADERGGRRGGDRARRASAMSIWRRPSSSSSPSPSAASASAPRPTNTGAPAAAARALSPCAMQRPRPASSVASFPVEESDQSCWSPTPAS